MTHTLHADCSAALGAAMQAAAVHTRVPVGDYCAAVASLGVTVLSSDLDNTGPTQKVYEPNPNVREVYQQLYNRSSSIWDVLYSDDKLLQMPPV